METSMAVFRGKEIRKTIHDNEWWFSVADVVVALTETVNSANTEGIFRYRFLLIYLLGSSCKQMQRHRALDDAKLAGMIWFEMGRM
jgi:prophage antirepressor-like protein